MIIKRLLFSTFIVALLCGAADTQAQGRRGRTPQAHRAPGVEMMKDGITMKDGKVLFTQSGRTTDLQADKTLVNGTTISTSGLVTAADGTTTQIGEGDQVSLTGRVTSARAIAEADSLAKIKMYDLKYPGRREKQAKELAKREEEKQKRAEARAKALEKRRKR